MSKPKANASELIDRHLERLDEEARAILSAFRAEARDADSSVVEDFKWSRPGLWCNGLICSYLSFKNHLAVWFAHGALMSDPEGLFEEEAGSDKGMRSIKFTREQPLHPKVFRKYLDEAIALSKAGKKVSPKPAVKQVTVPDAFKRALQASGVWETFTGMSPSHRREYVEHYTEAKREATRERRLEKIIGMVGEGAGLNDKYRK